MRRKAQHLPVHIQEGDFSLLTCISIGTVLPVRHLPYLLVPHDLKPSTLGKIELSVTMLIKRSLAATFSAPLALAYPFSEANSDSSLLFKRAGTTAQLGDYTGDTSSYPDGSGKYVDSKDQGTYASGVKCWTDIVRLHPTSSNPISAALDQLTKQH